MAEMDNLVDIIDRCIDKAAFNPTLDIEVSADFDLQTINVGILQRKDDNGPRIPQFHAPQEKPTEKFKRGEPKPYKIPDDEDTK